jgi:hypothetical protein
MYKASAGIVLPTSIIGSLPRPAWHTREGMSRRHAQYKMVAMVLGTNLVRKELGLPEAECLAADPRYSLAL